jgi:B12 binding domain/Radical SAM superfamily
MKLCLIAPPALDQFDEGPLCQSEASRVVAEHAPLGILSLAAVVERRGITPRILDLNRLHFEYSWPTPHQYRRMDFCSFAVQELSSFEFDVVGLSTMCSTYPLSLRIARELKQVRPSAVVVLGGPQASVVDTSTLKAFSFVDIIVRGEAEETFPRVLDAFEGKDQLKNVPGITFRDCGKVIRNANAPVIQDLDSLPLPAFHLYPGMEKGRYIPLELGRGCPFACTFCSTNDFFRRRFRLKSPARLLEEMTFLEQSYGINRFDLVHDMFTVDRRKVIDFCEALLGSGKEFGWTCSARTDFVDDDLLALMSEAGCRGIFFGIETGSPRMQKIIDKRLDLDEATRVVESTGKHAIPITVSMIDGFPQEERQDLEASVDFLMQCARFDHVHPQMNILAPLAETPLHTQYRDQLVLDDVFSGMSHQGWSQDAADRELIASYPEIFPNFYGIPCPVGRTYCDEFNRFFINGVARFRWLLVALHQESGDLLGVFDAWLAWGGRRQNPARYYSTFEFTREFGHFLRTVYLELIRPSSVAVAGLVDYHEALSAALSQSESGVTADLDLPSETVTLDSVPRLAEGVRVFNVDADVKEIIDGLRAKERLDPAIRRPTLLATRLSCDDGVELLRIPSLSAQLLSLCDGRSSIREIMTQFSERDSTFDKGEAGQVCLYGLRLLGQSALIEFGAFACEQARMVT